MTAAAYCALLVTWLVVVSVAPVLSRGQAGAAAARQRHVDERGSAQWWSRALSSLGVFCAVAAAPAHWAGLDPLVATGMGGLAAGAVLVLLGTVLSVVSQRAMGPSWRPDVDPDARQPLVTTGPFRVVRNPAVLGLAVSTIGLVVVLPNAFTMVMTGLCVAAWQVQGRLVEEPYLLRQHGAAYREYASRTGRFLPALGRLRP